MPWEYFEQSRPLPVTDGIAARSQRGAIGETWWSQRFIALLESFGVESRLKRGRSYARAGQVIELEVEPGIVVAKVQGSRVKPYRVAVPLKVLTEAQWARAEKAMAAQVLPLARLLAGKMPQDIEEIFAGARLSLFPATYRELRSTCSCPDATNPCKHLAAVYYLLAERFDADPFLIFTWRGRTQDELLDALRARRATAVPAARGPAREDALTAAPPSDPGPPLADCLATFWQTGPQLDDVRTTPFASPAPDALLRQFGPVPGTDAAAGAAIAATLAGAYATLAAAAERRALG